MENKMYGFINGQRLIEKALDRTHLEEHESDETEVVFLDENEEDIAILMLAEIDEATFEALILADLTLQNIQLNLFPEQIDEAIVVLTKVGDTLETCLGYLVELTPVEKLERIKP